MGDPTEAKTARKARIEERHVEGCAGMTRYPHYPDARFGDPHDEENPFVQKIPHAMLYFRRFSESTIPTRFNKLVELALYLEQNFGTALLDADPEHVLMYFQEVIDPKDIKKDSKENYRFAFNSYYKFIKKTLEWKDEHARFKNPVPPKEIFEFSGTSSGLEALPSLEHVFTRPTLERVIKHVYYAIESSRIYYIVCLITYTGARVSEICHLKLKDLDIENRWLITKVKSRKNKKGIYFFPSFFQPELRAWRSDLLDTHEDPEYVFQSRRSRKGHVSRKVIYTHLKNTKKHLALKCKLNPHVLRDFINTKRIEMRVPKDLRKLLLNQKTEVNIGHYFKSFRNRVYARNLYDKTCPFEKPFIPKKNKFDRERYGH